MGGGDKHFPKMFEIQKCLYYLIWMGNGEAYLEHCPKIDIFLNDTSPKRK